MKILDKKALCQVSAGTQYIQIETKIELQGYTDGCLENFLYENQDNITNLSKGDLFALLYGYCNDRRVSQTASITFELINVSLVL